MLGFFLFCATGLHKQTKMLLCWPAWSWHSHLCLFSSFFHNSTIFIPFLLHILLIQPLSKSCTTRQHQHKRPQAEWNTEGIFFKKILHYINHVAVLNSYSVRRPLYLVWKCKSAGLWKKKIKFTDRLYIHIKNSVPFPVSVLMNYYIALCQSYEL